MNPELKKYLETTLTQIMYGLTDICLTNNLPINQDINEISRKQILDKASPIIKKATSKIIHELEEKGIKAVEDMEKQSDTVTEMMDKLEKQMIKDVKKLS